VVIQFTHDLLNGGFYHKKSAESAKRSYLAVAKNFVLFCVIELTSYLAAQALRLDFLE
jgi:hypothetical protein